MRTGFPVQSVRTQPDEFKTFRKLDPGPSHLRVPAGMKRMKLDPGPSHVHVPAGMKSSTLHFSAFAALLAVVVLAAGCAQFPARRGSRPAPQQPLARVVVPTRITDHKASASL